MWAQLPGLASSVSSPSVSFASTRRKCRTAGITILRPFSFLRGVRVIDKPRSLPVGDSVIDFLPYTHTPVQHLAELGRAARARAGRKTLVAHLAVDGAQLDSQHRSDVRVEHDGEMVRVDSRLFEPWDQVFLGHYHH
jgi:hypothetical protein